MTVKAHNPVFPTQTDDRQLKCDKGEADNVAAALASLLAQFTAQIISNTGGVASHKLPFTHSNGVTYYILVTTSATPVES